MPYLSNHSLAMNLGILEGRQAHGTNCDTTCTEMLPGNNKDELPLIHLLVYTVRVFGHCSLSKGGSGVSVSSVQEAFGAR